ncbi:MAG: M23 family metallopeptidase [Nitrospirota bacterium]|nr:M23 family metallopeptidase [Nitrospirota bacterium]
MKHFLYSLLAVPFIIVLFINFKPGPVEKKQEAARENRFYTIAGIVRPNDTLEAIFEKHNLTREELLNIFNISKKIHNLSKLSIGTVYSFKLDREENRIQSMKYGIDDGSFLNVIKVRDTYNAEKINIEPGKKIGSLYITINENLINSMPGSHKEYRRLALELANIFAWDIDFSSDIRNGDSLKMLVEELWVGEVFKGFGDILAAEFINNGEVHTAYRFEHDGYSGYYDSKGNSLRKTLLRSPLKFDHVSSYFSKRRFHPILRIYRPHLGVDYAAPTGTPVSAAGSGTVVFAGYKGQNGNMVKINHKGGYETYYGHLSSIPKKIRQGATVSQGDIIGYVGSTGLASGPHLDYRIKRFSSFVNPLKTDLPRGTSVPKKLLAEFRYTTDSFNAKLESLTRPVIASGSDRKTSG